MQVLTTEEAGVELSFREAKLPPSLQELRQKLGRKAKQQKRFRFYSLYGLVCRADTLQAAWAAVRRNDGAPGVDGMTIEAITATPEGEAAFVAEIGRSLLEKTYRTQAVRRVYIRKDNGKLRPLGIPTVRDRVVQAAVLLILEPIFEADFEECSHGFRPGRSAHDALRAIQKHLKEGLTEVYDADLAGYFEGKLEGWLGLKINREKTRVIRVHEPGQSLDFLGYTFRKDWDLQGRPWRYWNLEPSRKALAKEREALRKLINPAQSHTPLPELIARVNRHRRGWANYFGLGYPRKAMRQMNRFVVERLTKHLHRRSQRGWRARGDVSVHAHLVHMGLVML